VVSLAPEDAARLQDCVAGDGIAVIPTDTVYGLACSPESRIAIGRIYELKGRASAKPAAIMFFALQPALQMLTELGPRTRIALEALLPGPVTLLLPNPERRFPLACDPGETGVGLLGLRVPVFCSALVSLAAVSVAVMQSSANLSGAGDHRRLQDVPIELREGADLVLDGGELPGVASTVIDLSEYERNGEWRIVREGLLDVASLTTVLGRSC
jgi:L-threonylcarbamoyladenylate synthase